jgi:hypothetical protein
VDHSQLVIVKRLGSRPEAEVAKSVLEAAGIDATIQADTAGGMREHLAWSGLGLKILVREEDAEDARAVLESAGNSAQDTGSRL